MAYMLCSGPECIREARAQRDPPLCPPHYYQMRKYGRLKPIRVPATATCSGPACVRPVRAQGFCKTHCDQFRQHGETWPIGTRSGKQTHRCRRLGCDERTASNYCETHRGDGGVCAALDCDLPRRGLVQPYCDKHAREDRRLRHFYGIDWAMLEAMKEEQGGACAVCEKMVLLHLDHDHNDGRARGLLCGNCNRALGLLGDDPVVLDRAAEYLRRQEVVPRVERMDVSRG